MRVEPRPDAETPPVGQDDLDAPRQRLTGRLRNDVHGEEGRRRFLGLALADLKPQPVELRLVDALRPAEGPHRQPAPPPPRLDLSPIRLTPQVDRRLCHGSPPFGRAPIVARAARWGSP